MIQAENDRERLLLAIHRSGRRKGNIAVNAGTDPPTLSKILAGTILPTAKLKEALARQLGFRVEEIFANGE